MAWGRPGADQSHGLHAPLQDEHRRMLVSIAGPTMNLLMALLASMVIVIASHTGASPRVPGCDFTTWCSSTWFSVFQLAAIPPLDGARSWRGCCRALCKGGRLSAALRFFMLLLLVLSPCWACPASIVMYPMGHRDRHLARRTGCGR